MSHEPFTDDERALRDGLGVGDPPPPRRTEVAFARAVGDAVRTSGARTPRLLVGGAALAGALAVAVLAVGRADPPPARAAVSALSYDFDEDAPSFAPPDTDEIDDASLLAFNSALDRALARQE